MKRSKMNFLVYPLVFLFAGILLAACVSPSVNMSKEWDIPAKYKEIKNQQVGIKPWKGG